jgi:hypothetical protein
MPTTKLSEIRLFEHMAALSTQRLGSLVNGRVERLSDMWRAAMNELHARALGTSLCPRLAPEGDLHTLCNSPRCSLGEGHTLPCDTKAQAPA